MSMFDFLKRSNQLMFGAAKDSLKDYTRDISDLGNAASQVRDKLSSTTKTARDTMRGFKSNGIVSGVSNWFYGKEFELNDADEMLFDNDEFDSGNPELNDTGEEAEGSLTTSSMKELVKGQVSSMYKIGSKQTEAGIANTAEIVTTISKSSAEIIAAVNNVNSSLINISGKLDGIVELLKPSQNTSSSRNDNTGWTDSNGRFTINSLINGFKNPNNINGSLGMVGSMASMLADPNMRKMMLTPESLVSMFIMDPLMNKPLNALGGRSVDSYGKQFQTFTHNMVQDAIQTLIEKTPFGDIIGREAYRGNLGKTENQYTKDAAVFDKATRHSIVSIIPEYLKKITEAVTGQKWNIDDRGYLTTKTQANPYSSIGNVLNGAYLDWDSSESLSKAVTNAGFEIDPTDMERAQEAWIWVVVHYVIYAGNRKNITSKTITDMLKSPKLDMYLDRAVEVFNSYPSSKRKNSRKILKDVLLLICGDKQSTQGLANAGNKYIAEIEQAARDVSDNNPNADQYVNQSSLNWDTSLRNLQSNIDNVKRESDRRREEERLTREAKAKYGGGPLANMRITNDVKQGLIEYDKAHPSSEKEEEVTSRIGNSTNTKFGFNNFIEEMNKYSKGIYDILKEGVVNVRLVTGSPNPAIQRGKRVHKLRARKKNTGGSTSEDSDGDPDGSSNEVAEASSGANIVDSAAGSFISSIHTNGIVNTIRDKVSQVKDVYTNKRDSLRLESISEKANSKNSTVSDMDKQRVQMVTTALQTAMQDGDGVEDSSKIRQLISNIEDSKLKQEMTKVAESVLSKESGSSDKEAKPQSLVGRLLSGIGGKIKSAFSFVLKPITFVLKGIGKGLKAYWNWTKRMWKSGLEDGKRGMNAIRGGISDYREASAQSRALKQEQKAQQLRERQRASVQMDDISTIKNSGTDLGGESQRVNLTWYEKLAKKTSELYEKKIKPKLIKAGNQIVSGLKWVGDKIKAGAKWVTNALKTVGSGITNVGSKIANSKFGQFVSNTASDAAGKVKEVASKINDSKAVKSIKSFGSDFAAGFNEARSEKKLAKLDKATPDTIADKETRTIREKFEEFISKFFNGDNKFAEQLRDLIEKDTKAVEDLNSNGKPQMDDINGAQTSGDLGKGKSSSKGSPQMADINDKKKPQMADISEDGGDGSGDDSSGGKSKGKALGKIASGAMDIGSMIMKIVGPVIAGMAGVQAITELIQNALKDILKPVGKLLTKLFKALEPIIEILKDALEPFIDTVVDILVDIITPVAPIIQSIFECIAPILDIVTVLLDAIMIPLMAIFDSIIVPSLELVTGCLKAIMGILQMGFGVLMTPLGAILNAVGKIIPGGGKIADKGKDLMTKGTEMVTSGTGMVVEGVKEAGLAALKLTGPGMIVNAMMGDDSTEEEQKTPESYQATNHDIAVGSAMDGIWGNGDVVNNYYYQNMYGSGNSTYNQNSYHNGMNMSQHGCGPIALADRANRMGGGIDPYSLTQAMMANGNYSTNAGTSVAGMISTGRSLGMNLVPGGVTTDSLRAASPSNPVTVIGSGIGFGTRSGANHYVNVVGTDSAGGAYVSNPMTGRVGRVKAGELVANSKLGLYGSGDDISYADVFGDSVASAFGELSNIWTNISDIFNFKESETAAEKTQKALNKEKNKRHIDNVKSKYNDDEWQAKYDELAKEHPKEDGESDEDYEYRINSMVADEFGQELKDQDSFNKFGEKTDKFGSEMGTFNTEYAVAADSVAQKEEEGGSKSFGKSGGFYSASGNVKLATDGYTPEFTDTNMDESTNGYYIHSPIHEFFAKMGGSDFSFSSSGNWFNLRNDPHTKTGEGTNGGAHQGLDILLSNGKIGESPIYAPTDGTLYLTQPADSAGGGGNYVEWQDADGKYHRIMHMDHFSDEILSMNKGDPIVGGKTLLGYYGWTGSVDPPNSSGAHIHYDIADVPYAVNSDYSSYYNPLTYFTFKPSATDGDSSYIEGDTLDEQMWQWLRFKGMKLPESSVAGIMGVWKAEGVQPRMIEGAYSEPETSLAEPIYDAIVGDPDNNDSGLQQLWDYTPEHAAGKNGGHLPNYMYNGHPWAGIGLAQWTAGRTYKLLKHAWEHGQRKWYELLPQLQYFEEELNSTHTKAGNELAAGEGHTPEEMAQMFWTDFEGYTWGKQADYDKRRNNARNVYDRFKGTEEINSTNFGKINSNADAYYAAYIDTKTGSSSSGSSSSNNPGYVGNGNSSQGGNVPDYNATSIAYNNYMHAHKRAGNDRTKKNSNWLDYVTEQRNRFDTYATALGNTKRLYLNDGNPSKDIAYLATTDQIGSYWLNKGKFDKSSELVNSMNRYTALFENGKSGSFSTKLLNALADDNNSVWNMWGNDIDEIRKYYKIARSNDTKTVPGIDGGDQWVLGTDILDKIIGTSGPRVVTKKGEINDPNAMKPTSVAKDFKNSLANLSTDADMRIPNIWGKEGDSRVRSSINSLVLPVRGSGDEIATDIVDIPPVDYSKFTNEDWNNAMWNSMGGQQPVVQYTEVHDSATNEQIDRILANEFKTSDRRTHEILEKIYTYLENKEKNDGQPKPSGSSNNGPQGSQDMFENDIPKSVYRLARG